MTEVQEKFQDTVIRDTDRLRTLVNEFYEQLASLDEELERTEAGLRFQSVSNQMSLIAQRLTMLGMSFMSDPNAEAD